jgi:hypothetical protein
VCVSVCLGDIEQSPSLSPLSKEIGTILCEASAQLISMASPPPTCHRRAVEFFALQTTHTHTHATKNKENGGGGKKKEISNREDET